jgi:hypothetical protein
LDVSKQRYLGCVAQTGFRAIAVLVPDGQALALERDTRALLLNIYGKLVVPRRVQSPQLRGDWIRFWPYEIPGIFF